MKKGRFLRDNKGIVRSFYNIKTSDTTFFSRLRAILHALGGLIPNIIYPVDYVRDTIEHEYICKIEQYDQKIYVYVPYFNEDFFSGN